MSGTAVDENKSLRVFDTGATRNPDSHKLDFEGYLSPLALYRYGRYMLGHSFTEDGSRRESDNWQKGIPIASYMKSLLRHLMELWIIHRGWKTHTKEELEDTLCAVMFNSMGYLHEILKKKCTS